MFDNVKIAKKVIAGYARKAAKGDKPAYIADFVKECKDILAGRSDHFWLDLNNDYGLTSKKRYVTGERAEEDGEAYAFCYITDKVDSDGYAYGKVILDCYPDKSDNDASLRKYAEYLLKGL